MKTFNINNISNIYTGFIALIPEILKEDNRTDLLEKLDNNKFSVPDFFDYIDWGDSMMLVWDNNTNNWVYITFCVINDKYIIYSLDDSIHETIEQQFFNKLKEINYNIKNAGIITDMLELSRIINESHDTVFLYKQQYRK